MSRRAFFINALMGVSLLSGIALMASYFVRFLFPVSNVKVSRKLYVGDVRQIPPGKSTSFTDLKGQKLNIVNTGDEFIALSTKCTHLGCQVFWKERERLFFCPCHDGFFDERGNVVKGPPPAPLTTYKVEVVGQGVYIYVDEVHV
ncbi:MAG: ubiquinol-cytochrome c reductase iron-sulfur subunit [Nitrospina sp.]|jgi:cytochrome b6-f complex iron-sulfur subunit|nr:ubiquinol-cytochrome c reductase iron-sulfur subunit [Nitrospina sp.]MBT3416197.1 ubiquinol-cytochrome c reductase iron-sulfur subunit [Nitrospina sp.]MBT3856535.1 ubiquinol-cytochrome c reductase iron-sulfur subunit [Nitrospina sp.]MBT4105589.1 ubiquinol-cytochrome c reductase iron-sulfur subunit [Nitrospina sp.]MBT4390241.1 ubiquinol-cytochrome c reductase iron-sulfur subunit [Nitrospina sp.]